MNLLYVGFTVFAFIAVALTIEAVWQWWFSTQSQSARRFSRRIGALTQGDGKTGRRVSLLKERRLSDSDRAHAFLRRFAITETIDTWLQQAGSRWSVATLLSWCLLAAGIGLLLGRLLFSGWASSLLVALLFACLPLLSVSRQKARRLHQFQLQLPEAADLIARSLRAGHALPSTLQMVAEEMPEPISAEFRVVSDEINYGLGLQPAMQRLAERVPLDDLRFLVLAVLIQRETGGNLAELMQNMASLIRERLKLLGQIQSLSAEGRLSGWILFLLPIVMAVLLMMVNPEYMEQLVADPIGQMLLGVAGVQMLLGAIWMRRLVNLRV